MAAESLRNGSGISLREALLVLLLAMVGAAPVAHAGGRIVRDGSLAAAAAGAPKPAGTIRRKSAALERPTAAARRAAGLALFLLAAQFGVEGAAQSRIARDGTLGSGSTATLRPSGTIDRFGTTYRRLSIPETQGLRVGPNVFHSFSAFSVGAADAAVFTLDAPTRNVVSRVTGGTTSTIRGLLALDPGMRGGTPAFFLLNPAGITFAGDAVVDVPGAFHVSTAHQVRFRDGLVHADPAAASRFTSADPVAFGFLAGGTGRVGLRDFSWVATSGQPISVTAAHIGIVGGGIETWDGGEVRLAATGASAAEVPLAGRLPSLAGSLTLAGGGAVFTGTSSAAAAGRVAASAGTIRLDGAGSEFFTGLASVADPGSGPSGSVLVTASRSLVVRRNGQIATDTRSAAPAGRVTVRARDILLDGTSDAEDATIVSESLRGASGAAGRVEVIATGTLQLRQGGRISSDSLAGGDAGNVTVHGADILVNGVTKDAYTTGISSETTVDGRAGAVSVRATGRLALLRGGVISSVARSSRGTGGIEVRAGDIVIDGVARDAPSTGISTETWASGPAGAVGVVAEGRMALLRGGSVTSSTFGTGKAGNVQVSAGRLRIDGLFDDVRFTGIDSDTAFGGGAAGTVRVKVAGALEIARGGMISSSTLSAGNGGSVIVNAGRLRIDRVSNAASLTGIQSTALFAAEGRPGPVRVDVAGPAEILRGGRISSSTFSEEDAGDVLVTAGRMRIDGESSGAAFTGISSQVNSGGSGNAGAVRVAVAGPLELLRGGVLASSTFGSGNGGSVEVRAESIRGAGQGVQVNTGIRSTAVAGSQGRAGDVTVAARDLLALEDARISTDSAGQGSAGNIAVRAGTLELVAGGQITSDTRGNGSAGSVRVDANDVLVDRRSAEAPFTGISSDALTGARGHAGLVQVSAANAMTLRRGGQVSSSTFAQGNAGSVTVHAGELLVDGESESLPFTGIASDSQAGSGRAGAVDVQVARRLTLWRSGSIQSHTFTTGDAGSVVVRARDIEIDGMDLPPQFLTGVGSDSMPGAGGHAGTVDVAAAERLVLRRGGSITSSTESSGNAGSVLVRAGEIVIARESQAAGLTGISSSSGSGGGRGGSVEVDAAGTLHLLQGGVIHASTWSGSDAGRVTVRAGAIEVDGAGFPAALTGITSDAQAGAAGNAGPVDVTVAGTLALRRGGRISSSTRHTGHAGGVVVNAGEILVDSESEAHGASGVFTTSQGTGHAGSVAVGAAGRLVLLRGGALSSDTAGAGAAGSVTVRAREILVDGQSTLPTGISSDSREPASGPAGQVDVSAAASLALLAGGSISSETFGSGKAGSVTVHAGDLLVDGAGAARTFTGVTSRSNAGSGDAGSVQVAIARGLALRQGGAISSSTTSAGNAGTVAVRSQDMLLEGGSITSESGREGSGRGGRVEVTAVGGLSLRDGGSISSGTFGNGDAGTVQVAAGDLSIEGARDGAVFTGVTSSTNAGSGRGGAVTVHVARGLTLLRGGAIASSTASSGDAGSVDVDAGSIHLHGTLAGRASGLLVEAGPGSSGQAGNVRITTRELVASDGARISSDTRGTGDAGSVTLQAGTVRLASGSFISSRTFDAGHAGKAQVTANELLVDGSGDPKAATGISSEAREGSRGKAGSVEVAVQGALTALDRGVISTSTYGSGDAGSVVVRAARVELGRAQGEAAAQIASQAGPGSTGAAGNVQVVASETVTLRGGGSIASSTFGQGAAGSVELTAPRVHIDGQGASPTTGILSQAEAGSAGNAGSVRVNAPQELLLANGARISSSTFAQGAGGSVGIDTGTLRVQAATIAAQAGADSAGQTGSVTIAASHAIELLDHARLSIQNDATVADRTALRSAILRVTAPEVSMTGAAITAASTGNVAASSVDVGYTGTLLMQGSSITTTSSQGDGGAIRVRGGRTLEMKDSQISTSVAGLQGNGGDIEVQAGTLLMRTAFIQANTAAADASGGNVLVDAGVLVPTGGSLVVGGTVAHTFAPGVFGFNLIQAAAPTGLSGDIAITSPALDIAATLAGLNASAIAPAVLAGSPCLPGGGSSLVRVPRGALPPSQREGLAPSPFGDRPVLRGGERRAEWGKAPSLARRPPC